MKKFSKNSVVQFIQFGLVGVSNTAISLGVYYIFLWFNKEWYLIGNVVGWIVSVGNAFYWNNKYVFDGESTEQKVFVRKLGRTYLSYGGTFLLSTGLLFVEVNYWRWSEVLSPIANMVITIPLNFLLNKFWTFR